MFLWWQEEHPRLTAPVRSTIAGAEAVFVSAASAWEAAIKSSLGRLSLPDPFELGVEKNGFHKLMVTFAHAEAVRGLPAIHGDPFDRLLLAQAQVEELTLVTADSALRRYPVGLLHF